LNLINGDSMEVLKTLEADSIDSVISDPPYGLSQISTQVFNECMLKWCTNDREYIPASKGFMGKAWDSFVPPPALFDEVFRVLKPGGHALIFAGSRTQDLMGLSLRLAGFEIRDCIQWLYGSGFPKSLNIGKAIDKIQGNEREVIGKGKSGSTAIWNTDGNMGSWNITKGSSEYEGYGTALKPAYEPIILTRKPFEGSVAQNVLDYGTGGLNIDGCRIETNDEIDLRTYRPKIDRYPSNVIFDESNRAEWSRYFYTAKTSTEERHKGIERNIHPTVKPIDLMKYLCRLITPPAGVVLDPFMGSGSTGIAALKEGFDFIGIEREAEYFEIAQKRIDYWTSIDLTYEDNEEKPLDSQLSIFGG